MMYVKSVVEEKIKVLHENRHLNIKEYINCLTWTAHYGGIDQIYYYLKFLDRDYIAHNSEVKEEGVYQRLSDLIKKIDDGIYSDLTPFILKNENLSEADYFLVFNKYFDNFKNKEAGHEEIFVLSFLVKLLVENTKLNAELAIEVINYFWKAKNCNEYRKDFCIFITTDACIEYKLDQVLTLRKQWYDHIQKIYAKVYSTKILSSSEKRIYTKILGENIKRINILQSTHSPKIAVCISGMYRNHQSALESIKKNIVDPLNADVFIHTWDEMAIWTGLGGPPFVARLFGNEALNHVPQEYHLDFKKITEILPKTYHTLSNALYKKIDSTVFDLLKPKKVELEDQSKFEQSLGDNTEGYTKSRGNLNQIKMFHGIKESINLAIMHDQYDFIIRLRPDILIQEQLKIEKFNEFQKNTLYTGLGDYGVKDTAFITSSSACLSLSNLITQMFKEKRVSPYRDFPRYDAHNIFFSWVVENSLDFDQDLIKMNLLNMANVSAKLPNLKNSLDQDFELLSQENKTKFLPFIEFLKQNYCEE